MSEKRNIPKLRFPGSTTAWETKRLEDLARIERGRFSPRPRNNPIYYGGKIPFVQTGDVVRSNGKISNYSQTLNEKGLEVSKLFPAGSILITIAANIGFSGVLEIPMACPDSLIGLTCKPEIKNTFLNYLLQIEQPTMDLLASAAAQKNINVEFLKPYKLTLPSLSEQQKIASFLTAVDRRIELLQQKKEKLERYKKGVMQQLFTRKIRFKADDGSEFPDWEDRELRDVIIDFLVPMRDKPKDLKGPIPWCRIEDFNGRYLSASKSEQGVSLETIAKMRLKIFPINTLIVSCSAYLGRCAIVKSEIITNQTFIGLVPDHAKVDVEFLFYIMILAEHRLNTLSSGTTISYLSREQFEKFKVSIPSLLEQKKISQFLNSVDENLGIINQQINQSQTWKKGLLQQMFV